MPEFHENNTADPDLSKKVYFSILTLSFLWTLMIFLAPLLMHSGDSFKNISYFLYIFFSKVCHQQDDRSFHLFEHVLGVCSRCVWIYTGFFIGTVLYPLKYKLNNITPPSVLLLIVALFFLICDVMLDSFGILMNTFFSRSVTGFLIGISLPLYLIPGFVKFFDEVNSFLRKKVNI
ncbi:MAG: DUF2085 domain-containing protein [Ignavibacteria bacterium]|nr:DUF2085 domain-containing protein [Ignavibacteria bacterium]